MHKTFAPAPSYTGKPSHDGVRYPDAVLARPYMMLSSSTCPFTLTLFAVVFALLPHLFVLPCPRTASPPYLVFLQVIVVSGGLVFSP